MVHMLHSTSRTDKKLSSFKSFKWISGQGGVDKVYQFLRLEDGMIDKSGVRPVSILPILEIVFQCQYEHSNFHLMLAKSIFI